MSHSSHHHAEQRSEHRPDHRSEHRHDHESGHAARQHAGERGSNGPQVQAQVRGSTDEIAGYLTALADAMRSGGVQIRAGDRAVGLHLADQLSMELRAEPSDGQSNQIAVRITWETESLKASPATLHISSLRTADQQANGQGTTIGSGLNAAASTTSDGLPPLWTPANSQLPSAEGERAEEGQAEAPNPAEGEVPGSEVGF